MADSLPQKEVNQVKGSMSSRIAEKLFIRIII